MRLHLLPVTCLLMLLPNLLGAQGKAADQPASTAQSGNDELRYVVYLNRHGIRSPTGRAEQYNRYSTAPWPAWPVLPGYLTPHGFHLMELIGAFDRSQLAAQGLLSNTGCADASRVTIYADSDQRTRETGKAIAHGLMPDCDLSVHALPEGANDPLFHFDGRSLSGAPAVPDATLAVASIAGRIGGDPTNLTQAYDAQISALDHVLASCGTASSSTQASAHRVSLLEIPATLSAGNGDHLAELKGPLATAATLSENLLLEYTEGMDAANVGWGCVQSSGVRQFLALHTAAVDFTQRTPEIARPQAYRLLNQIHRNLQQAAEQKALPGAIGKPSDRVLFLVGHDTNQENIAGLLNLTWIIDGRRDDTPPGGAILFELWRNRSSRQYSVRLYFTAQTLHQMRDATPLTLSSPPERVPVFVPGCSRADMSCSLPSFLAILEQAAGRGTPPGTLAQPIRSSTLQRLR